MWQNCRFICHRARNHPGPAGAEPGGGTRGSKSKLTAARVLKAETSADYPWRANTYQTVMHGWARPYEPLLIIPGDLRAVLFYANFRGGDRQCAGIASGAILGGAAVFTV